MGPKQPLFVGETFRCAGWVVHFGSAEEVGRSEGFRWRMQSPDRSLNVALVRFYAILFSSLFTREDDKCSWLKSTISIKKLNQDRFDKSSTCRIVSFSTRRSWEIFHLWESDFCAILSIGLFRRIRDICQDEIV